MTNFVLTTALPYANGNLHIGHIYEAVLADIKSRAYTIIGKKHSFVSGADSHGSATTLYCKKHNLNIEEHLEKQHAINSSLYKKFNIGFQFSKTNTQLHNVVVNECINLILNNEKTFGKVFELKEVFGWYDSVEKQYLPDRYVNGKCPFCSAENQVEICDNCQKIIEDKLILNPKSTLSKNSVILKENLHLVLKTKDFYDYLLKNQELIPESIRDFVLNNKNNNEFIDISREKPYYGIDIDEDKFGIKNQCFYVWFDAPLGYITFGYEQYLKEKNVEHSIELFIDFIQNVEFEHFIGKDIVYFHTFLWFNLLRLIINKNPISKINIHGWITENKKKLSKKNGSFLHEKLSEKEIRAYRLFFFSKFNGTHSDIELNNQEINEIYTNLIVNKFGNFYTRSTKLLEKLSPNKKQLILSKSDLLNSKSLNSILEGNYKFSYEYLVGRIDFLNTEFANQKIWKEENKEKAEAQLLLWLNEWNILFQTLKLIIPEFEKYQEQIDRLEFFYLDTR